MADNLTRDTIEKELQRDLAELEGRGKPKTMKKEIKQPTKKKETRKATEAPALKKKEPVEAVKKETKTTPAREHKKPTPETPDQKQESSDDDVRSKRIFYGGIAAIILIFAALLIGGKYLPVTGAASTETVTYNGYTFVKDQTHWVFNWQNNGIAYQIPLRFNAQEAESVYVEGVLNPRFNKLSPVYITFDPTSPESNFSILALGAGELSFNLVQALGKTVESACAVDDNGPACANRTIIDCDNSEGKAVIYLKTEEPSGIYIEDTCIIVRGKDMELLRSIDRLLYNWYGVIP